MARAGSSLCNKCRQFPSLDEDSWCTSCSALQLVHCDLRARWGNPELRRATGELLVDVARQVKVLRNLSLRLTEVREDREVLPRLASNTGLGASSKSQGAPPPAKIPPVPPPPPREEAEEPDPEESYTYEYTDEEDEIEEEREPLERASTSIAPPVEPKVEPKVEVPEKEERKRLRREETEKRGRSSGQKEKRRKHRDPERRRGRRGGRKHQQVSRKKHDPNVRIHRKRTVKELKES